MARTIPKPEWNLSPHADNMSALGRLVRNRRVLSGLTLMDAADQLGISKSALSRLENGTPVTLDLVFRVLSGFGLGMLVLDKGQLAEALTVLDPINEAP